MNKILELKIPPIEYQNSAGRLLALLSINKSCQEMMLSTQQNGIADGPRAFELVHDYLASTRRAFDVFFSELQSCEQIPNATKKIALDGLSQVRSRLAPAGIQDTVEFLQAGEAATLRMVASMLDSEQELPETDLKRMRESVESLKELVEKSDLPKSVREAIQRSVRLTQNAIDEYVIRGARGFRDAFHQMLGDLMEVYAREQPAKDRPPEWWKKAYSHLSLVDAIASRLLTYTPVLESTTVALLQLPHV